MVDKDEWYPVFSIVESDDSWASEGEVEFPHSRSSMPFRI
jgi:hypothetical protein